jgi:hypothetical protein
LREVTERPFALPWGGVAAERLQPVADALRLRVREMFTFEPG